MTLAFRRRLDILAWVLTAGVFALDLALPQDLSIGLLYVVVLLLGLWTPSARDVLVVAGFATVLSVIHYVVSPTPYNWSINLSNEVLQVGVVWITALGVYRYRRTLLQRGQAERQALAAEARLREQAALAQIGQMAAVVAHEVRNPLAGIRGAVQVISRRLAADAPEQKVADEVVKRIDTLASIVQDLLQFARPRQPVPVQVAFGLLVRPIIDLLRDDPAMAQVTLAVEGDDVCVFADPELLKLVLHNLVINSADAMERNGRIVLEARSAESMCEIRVVDGGPGIPPAVRERLFEPFFTTKHRGTGLGLASARRLVQAHGGTLSLACPPTGGTVAEVRLPRAGAGG